MSSKRLRFTSDDDLCLLREFVGQNPLKYPENWSSIQSNIKSVTGKEFAIRTLKDHVMLLLTLWKKKSNGDKFRSGTEEMYTEKDTLLQEISDLCAEFPMPNKKTKVISKEKQIAELGRQTRENIAIDAFIVNSEDCSGISEEIIISREHDYFDPDPNLPSTENCVEEVEIPDVIFQNQNTKSQPTVKKSTGPGIARRRQNKSVVLRRNAMEYLKNKNEKEQAIKLKELQLQEQKLKLDERRIEIEEKRVQMEIEDRKKKNELEFERFKCDIKQRSELQAHISAQQTFLDTLLKRLQKYED